MGRIQLQRERAGMHWRSVAVVVAAALWFLGMYFAHEHGQLTWAIVYALGPAVGAVACLRLWLRDRRAVAIGPLAIWSHLGLPFAVGLLLAATGAMLWRARELPDPMWWRLLRLAATLWGLIAVIRLGRALRGVGTGDAQVPRVT